MRTLDQKAFTLLEVIVTMGMMAIILVTAYYYMGNQGKNSQLRNAAAELTGNMNLARNMAVRDTRPWAIQFNPGGNSYVVFSNPGEPYAPTDPADPVDWTDGDETTYRSVTLPGGISFGSGHGTLTNPSDSVGDGVSYTDNRIVFFPNGICSGDGSIYLTTTDGYTFAVTTLSATGNVRVQSNNGSGWSE